ncbi:MAG: lytic transglycosylase domain-containing protein, partial [Dichotomicrobium sp.]
MILRIMALLLLAFGIGFAAGHAPGQPVHDKAKEDAAQKTIIRKLGKRAAGVCPVLDEIARKQGLPPLFFARLIWQESRFRSDAISPKGAQGIAQFMPGTADLRGLADPFEPNAALKASAAFLADLRAEFGNLGLAAAAYNAGPQRVRDWLAGNSVVLPAETRSYVAIITGRLPEDWRTGDSATQRNAESKEDRLDLETPDKTACQRLVAVLERGAPALDIETAPAAPWGVQVAGNFSRAKTVAQFRRVQQRFSNIIGERKPIVRQERNLSLGRRPVYQARLGAQSRQEAR